MANKQEINNMLDLENLPSIPVVLDAINNSNFRMFSTTTLTLIYDILVKIVTFSTEQKEQIVSLVAIADILAFSNDLNVSDDDAKALFFRSIYLFESDLATNLPSIIYVIHVLLFKYPLLITLDEDCVFMRSLIRYLKFYSGQLLSNLLKLAFFISGKFETFNFEIKVNFLEALMKNTELEGNAYMFQLANLDRLLRLNDPMVTQVTTDTRFKKLLGKLTEVEVDTENAVLLMEFLVALSGYEVVFGSAVAVTSDEFDFFLKKIISCVKDGSSLLLFYENLIEDQSRAEEVLRKGSLGALISQLAQRKSFVRSSSCEVMKLIFKLVQYFDVTANFLESTNVYFFLERVKRSPFNFSLDFYDSLALTVVLLLEKTSSDAQKKEEFKDLFFCLETLIELVEEKVDFSLSNVDLEFCVKKSKEILKEVWTCKRI